LNRQGTILRLGFRFLKFFKGALIPNFNKTVEHELLIMGVWQLEDVFSVVLTNLRAWVQRLTT
jgi:hypothetical protein